MVFGRHFGVILGSFWHHFCIICSTSFWEAFWEHFVSIWEAFWGHFGDFFDPGGHSERKRRFSRKPIKTNIQFMIFRVGGPTWHHFGSQERLLGRPKTTSIFASIFDAKSDQKGIHLGSLLAPKRGRKSMPKINRTKREILPRTRGQNFKSGSPRRSRGGCC